METNPLKDGVLTIVAQGLGTITRSTVRQQAVELAFINGRTPQQVTKADWDEAKLQLTGMAQAEPATAGVDSLEASGRWDAAPVSTGERIPAAASEDADEEGQSDQQRLTEEGLDHAEFHHRLQAAEAESGPLSLPDRTPLEPIAHRGAPPEAGTA